MRTIFRRSAAVAAFFLVIGGWLAGCERRTQTKASDEVSQIAWYKGSVDQALLAAKTQRKPLLIYWGAVWCPYCQELRKTVFTRTEFIEKTALFIPVYLDGDLQGAQQWGGAFKIAGYPTLLILRPDRTEITRLSGGLDPAQYASLLDEALQDQRPIMDVLHNVRGREDCHRLAYYGWDPEALEGLSAKTLAQSLTDATAHCEGPDQVRLEILALSFALQAKEDATALQGRIRLLFERLKTADAISRAIDLIAGLDDSLYVTVTALGPDFAAQFRDRFVARMQEASTGTRFTDSDRLIALASALDATKALRSDRTIPIPMQEEARTRVKDTLTAERDRFKRSDVVNAAGIVYGVMGDDEATRALYLQELPNTRTPYYYMSHLAALAEKHSRPQEALDWLARAYAASQGPATRLRWESAYVLGLIRLAPDDVGQIRAAALQVASETKGSGASRGRSLMPMDRIQKALEVWATTPQRREVAAEVSGNLSGL